MNNEVEVKISIVVPIYNVSKYLESCLDSLCAQTLADIEIICIDDGSTDNSCEIIRKYKEKDQRVKPLLLEKNAGICVARKRGVFAAKGQYIIFCDGDDELVPQACEIIWGETQKESVDILQYGTNINFLDQYPKEQKEALVSILKPCLGTIRGDICKECFHNHRFGHTLWNKAYSSELCKKAFCCVADEHIVVSEDIYAFFIITYFARTYRGVKEKLYVYNYGAGVTGKQHLNLSQFTKLCGALDIIPLLEMFIKDQAADRQYYNYYQAIKKNAVQDIVYHWKQNLAISVSYLGYELMLKKLGPTIVVSELARGYWDEQPELVRKVTAPELSKRGGKKVQRLGVYYHRMRNGGAERVISKLLVTWKQLGYEIVLFTDEEATEEDYPIPDDVIRIVLPSFQTALTGRYKKRARCWEAMIKKYDIDTMLYNSSTCHILFWDVCLLKGVGCNLIIETHSMFSAAMWYSPTYATYLPLIYRMVDCTVSLSKVDVAFWQNYCPAYYIQNPITLVPREEMALKNSLNVLWVGRFSDEKQPFSLLEVFAIVSKSISTATLTIVGEGDSQDWRECLEKRAKELGIDECVEFCGFQLDVAPYYQKASVFAFTSMCEAAPVVLTESKSYGLPIVMFDLPNVEIARDERGVVKVPQNDILLMANSIIMLLNDENLRQKLGEEGRASIESLLHFDVEKAWEKLFHDIEDGLMWAPDENLTIMLDLLFQNVSRGLKAANGWHEVPCYTGTCRQHEEILERHEEVVNRHEQSINHQWEVQKWHEERLQVLEKKTPLLKRVLRRLRIL